jgi:molybdopterin-guanine dinucleotide biosynthesis protein A
VHGLILAGGEGARLAADGVPTPKAVAPVGGRPQLVALVDQMDALGCTSITCMVHERVAAQLAGPEPGLAAVAGRLAGRARVVPCRTPASLHTLAAGLRELPPGDVFCSMVDTVMAAEDWRAVHASAACALARGADAVLAVTGHARDDDAPLWVRLGADGAVACVGGGPSAPPRVTGGVYAFAPAARARVPAALDAGRQRMREFLADLVDAGGRVHAVEVRRIIDVDHRRDLDEANAYLAERNAHANSSGGRG